MPDIELTAPNGRNYTLEAPEGATPEQIQEKAQQFKQALLRDPYGMHEKIYGLPAGYLAATQRIETGGDKDPVNAKSQTGVRGLMQITKATGKKYGLTAQNFLDPLAQIDAAAQIHRDNLKTAGGDEQKAAALYGDRNEPGYAGRFMAKLQAVRAGTEQPHPVGLMGQGAPAPPGGSPGPGTAAAAEALSSMASGSRPTAYTTDQQIAAMSSPVLRTAARIGAASYYDGLLWPASRLNALGHSLNVPGFVDPKEFKATRVAAGAPHATELPTDEPSGIFDRLVAASAPLEATYAPTFGSYVLVRGITGDERAARATEALVGIAGAAWETEKLFAARAARREKTSLEKAVTAATDDSVAKAQAAAQAGVVAEQQVQKAMDTLPAVRGVPSGGAPTKAELGTQLQAIGPEAGTMGPEGVREKGLAAMSGRLRQEVHAAYEQQKALGTKAEIAWPKKSGTFVEFQRAITDYGALIHARASGATPAEKALAAQASELGGIGYKFKPDGSVKEIINRAKASIDEPIPYGALVDFHSAMGNVAMDPREFPVSHSVGRRAFIRVRTELDHALRTLEAGHPEVTDAAFAARALVRTRQRPFERTARGLLRAGEPEAAAGALFSPKKPTRLVRVLQESSPPEVVGTQRAGLRNVFEEGMDSRGNMDWKAAQRKWEKGTDPVQRRLYAALGNDRAQARLFEMIRDKKINANDPLLIQAERDMGHMFEAHVTAEQAAKEAGRTEQAGRTKVIEFGRPKPEHGVGGSFMVRRSVITVGMGTIGAGAGHPIGGAVSAAAYLTLAMTYPRLVAKARLTPLNTQRGLMLAKAIQGILRAQQPDEPQQGSGPVLPAGQGLPSPAPGEQAVAAVTRPAPGGGQVVSSSP